MALSKNSSLSRVGKLAEETTQTAVNKAKRGADVAARTTRSAARKATETVDDARLRAGKAADQANRIITEHPVTAVAGAIIVGAAIAYLFPRGSRAIRTLAPKIADVLISTAKEARATARANLPVEQVGHIAQSVADSGKRAPEALRETVNALPASAAHLRDEALDLAHKIGAEASRTASRVRKATLRAIK
jgi:ElaB/YqjD/DUF883 family membrane-anchored ribosome-binding protein